MKPKLSWPKVARGCLTLLKAVGVALVYLWLGAAYKLVYAQSHDITKFERKIPLPYYQQQFVVESLTGQTWMFGPEFQAYLGKLPSLGALFTANPFVTLADYCRVRERELAELPRRYPHGQYSEEALGDAYGFYSQGAAVLSVIGAREQPRRVLRAALPQMAGVELGAVTWPLPDDSRVVEAALRLGNGFPGAEQAPDALLRAAQSREREGKVDEAQELYGRIAREYPRSEASITAAEALYDAAEVSGSIPRMREYRRRALEAAERVARDRYPGRALPARNTITILGQRVDLSGLELRVQNEEEAESLLAVATREADRVRATRSLDEGARREFRRTRERMERVRNELWVADLYRAMEVGIPGPPPRPQEYAVLGRALLDGKPLAGVEIALTQGNPGRRIFGGNTLDSRYRARTGADGRLRIPDVPAGEYGVNVVYETRPATAAGAAMVPEGGEYGTAFPARVVVEGGVTRIPDLRFQRGIAPVTFGEVAAEGDGLRLHWNLWPGAASYRVEVLAAPEVSREFQERAPGDQRTAFRRRPVLWTSAPVTGTTVLAPLRPIAPDNPSRNRLSQWEYQVTALDGKDSVLAISPPALARFTLSVAAQSRMLELKPPVYRRARQPRGGQHGGRAQGGQQPTGGQQGGQQQGGRP